MKFQVYIYQDEDGKYISECPIIPGCASCGDTYEEAIEMIKDAIQGCLEVQRELGINPKMIVDEVEVDV